MQGARSLVFAVVPLMFVLAACAQPAASNDFDCPVTDPGLGFRPPAGYPAAPAIDDAVWYGTADLWTAVELDDVQGPRKSVWWSANFPGGDVEERPDLAVRYLLLETGEIHSHAGPATNAFTDEDGWFIIAGIDPEVRGCWQVTATYKGAELTYVFESE